MSILKFLKPDRAKIIYFIFLIIVEPFPYFIFSEVSSQYEVRWIWGFPPLVHLIYDYLPSSLQELNKGILEIVGVKNTFYWIPTYAFFLFLLSCVINLIIGKIRTRYGITTFRGFLWRKLRRPLKKIEQSEKKVEEKKEEKPEEEPEEIDERKIKEMSSLIIEEESFLKEQKGKLQKYLDEMNIKKLKDMGVDLKENKIFCSDCKNWKSIPREELMKMIKKHGFDIIWEYKCKDCEKRK